jgi:5-methylthioadenosine/S-adenosylhomocysteine deaminase
VMANGEVTTVDVAHLRQELFERSQWQASRHSQTRQALEARYRSVMGLG